MRTSTFVEIPAEFTPWRVRLLQVPPELEPKLRDFWSYFPPNYRWHPGHNIYRLALARAKREGLPTNELPGWDGRKRLYSRQCVPAGLFRATYRAAEEELGVRFVLRRKRPNLPSFLPGLPLAEEKYAYQDECSNRMCKALQYGGGLVLAATGTGKTATTARFLSRLSLRTLFVVDQLDLLYQSKDEIAYWLGAPIGVVGNSGFRPQQHTVATIQTLQRHLRDPKFKAWFEQIQVVIVDEFHEQLNRRSFDLIRKIRPLARYALTATLQMRRKEIRFPAFAFAGPVLFELPLQEAVKRKVLTKGYALQLCFPAGAHSRSYATEYQQEVVSSGLKSEALALVLHELVKRGRHTIVLAERILHLKRLSDRIALPHELAIGESSKYSRAQTKLDLEAGELNLVFASRIFKKGIDLKRVDTIVDMAERVSRNDTQQKFGRGARLFAGKQFLVYIDFATHGSVWLDRAAKARRAALRALGVDVKSVHIAAPEAAGRAVSGFLDFLYKRLC